MPQAEKSAVLFLMVYIEKMEVTDEKQKSSDYGAVQLRCNLRCGAVLHTMHTAWLSRRTTAATDVDDV